MLERDKPNSKNSFGGYTGKQSAWLHNLGGENWYVDRIDENLCYSGPLAKLSANDDEEAKTEKEIVNLLAKIGRKVNGYQITVINREDPASDKCVVLASEAMTSKRLALDTTGASREHWDAKYQSEIAKIISGECKG